MFWYEDEISHLEKDSLVTAYEPETIFYGSSTIRLWASLYDDFAALKPIPWVKVVETSTPPKTYVATEGRHRVLSPEGGTKPIGHRIIEIPESP